TCLCSERPPTALSTPSLHDALPIYRLGAGHPSFLGGLDFGGALDALRGLALAAGRALALGETRLERFHEVDDLRLGSLGRLLGDLLAVHLPLDLLLDSHLDRVLVLLGLELLRRRLLDDLHRHVQLRLLPLVLPDRYLVDRPH